jgi:hypothetical protein
MPLIANATMTTLRLAAGEPFIARMALDDKNPQADPPAARRFVMSLYGTGRTLINATEGVLNQDGNFYFVRNGTWSDGLVGQQGLKIELSERLLSGKLVYGTASLTIDNSVDIVPSFGIIIARSAVEITATLSANGLPSLAARQISYLPPVSPADDLTPDAFAFEALSNQATNSLVTSNEVTITGISAPAPVSVSGGEYRIGTGSWTSATNSITSGQKLRVRLVTSSSYNTISSLVLNVGTGSATWNVGTVNDQSQVGALEADRPYMQMRTAETPGTRLWAFNTIDSTPVLAKGNDNFALEPDGEADGKFWVKLLNQVEAGEYVTTVEAEDGETTVPITAADFAPIRTKFRNVLEVEHAQWQTDRQVWEMDHHIPTMSAPTHRMVKDGYADDPNVWDVGFVPDNYLPTTKPYLNKRTGQLGTISTGQAVVYTDGYSLTVRAPHAFRVKEIYHNTGRGTLRFECAAGLSLLIHCDTLFAEGIVEWHAANPSALIKTIIVCHQDPGFEHRLGIVLHGPSRMYGAKRAPYLHVSPNQSGYTDGTMAEGQVTFKVPGAYEGGWRAGDHYSVPSTDIPEVSSNKAEFFPANAVPEELPDQFFWKNTTFGINGVTGQIEGVARGVGLKNKDESGFFVDVTTDDWVTLSAPLQRPRKAFTGAWNDPDGVDPSKPYSELPRIVNYTRNLTFESAEGADRMKRGQAISIHPDTQWHWAHFDYGGRSSFGPSIFNFNDDDTFYDAAGTQPMVDPRNQIGFYPWHLHFGGVTMNDPMVVLEGLSVSSHWHPILCVGIAGHHTNHHMSRCTIKDMLAKGWLDENGSERTEMHDNCVSGVTGDGYHGPTGYHGSRYLMNGTYGTAYDMQSRAVSATDNFASSCLLAWGNEQQNHYIMSRNLFAPQLLSPQSNSPAATDPFTLAQGQRMSTGEDFLDPRVPRLPWPSDVYGVQDTPIPLHERNVSVSCWIGRRINARERTDRSSNYVVAFKDNRFFNVQEPILYDNYVNNYLEHGSVFHLSEPKPWGAANLGSGGASWAMSVVRCVLKNYALGLKVDGLSINYNGHYYLNDFQNVATPIFQRDPETVRDGNGVPIPIGQFEGLNIMGPSRAADGVTLNPTNWPIYIRFHRNMRRADINQNGKLGLPGPHGTNEADGVVPTWAGADPGFYVDPSSVTTLDLNNETRKQMAITGFVVDGFGLQRFGANFNPDNPTWGPAGATFTRNVGYRTPRDFLRDNGMFLDGSTYKIRPQLVSHDRATGLPIFLRKPTQADIPLANVGPQDMKYLIPHPDATKQADFMKPEAQRSGPPLLASAAPLISSIPSGGLGVAAGSALALALKTENFRTVYTLEGSHAAKFQLQNHDSGPNAYWRELEFKPGQATPGTYQVTVRATDPLTDLNSTRSVTVTVSALGVIEAFTHTGDVLAGPNASAYQAGSTAGLLTSNGNGTGTFINGGDSSTFLGVETGSFHHKVTFNHVAGTHQHPVWLGAGPNSYIYLGFKPTQTFVRVNFNGSVVLDTQAAFTWNDGDQIGARYSGATGELFLIKNGVGVIGVVVPQNMGTVVRFHSALDPFVGAVIGDLRVEPL